MASLTFSSQTHLNFQMNLLKVKIRKEHQQIFCGPSNIFKNISWPIDICLRYFMNPAKTLRPPPAYLMYGPYVNVNNLDFYESYYCSKVNFRQITNRKPHSAEFTRSLARRWGPQDRPSTQWDLDIGTFWLWVKQLDPLSYYFLFELYSYSLYYELQIRFLRICENFYLQNYHCLEGKKYFKLIVSKSFTKT